MLSLLDLRNRHFLNAARRLIEAVPANGYLDLQSIAAKVANSPAPRYYCNYSYALRMLYVYRSDRIKLKEGRRKALWAELNAKVDRKLAAGCPTVSDALADVLAGGGASQFFISPVTALNILRRYFDPSTRSLLIP